LGAALGILAQFQIIHLTLNPRKDKSMNARFLVLVSLILLTKATAFAAVFMDIVTLTPGVGTAGFTGTLAGVGVTATLAGGPNTSFNSDVPPGIGFSTTDGSSPQWSPVPGVYTPTDPATDRVGFSQTPGGAALVTVGFSSPMTDLVFHIANLDFSSLDFSPSAGSGLTGMTLLSGNGGAGDGIVVGPPLIGDALPPTADSTPVGAPVPLGGARSAYGSVLLSGTYSTISFVIIPGGSIDDANFTFSTPEPSMTTLGAIGLIGIVFRRRRRAD
jgi:hypothetical protein